MRRRKKSSTRSQKVPFAVVFSFWSRFRLSFGFRFCCACVSLSRSSFLIPASLGRMGRTVPSSPSSPSSSSPSSPPPPHYPPLPFSVISIIICCYVVVLLSLSVSDPGQSGSFVVVSSVPVVLLSCCAFTLCCVCARTVSSSLLPSSSSTTCDTPPTQPSYSSLFLLLCLCLLHSFVRSRSRRPPVIHLPDHVPHINLFFFYS